MKNKNIFKWILSGIFFVLIGLVPVFADRDGDDDDEYEYNRRNSQRSSSAYVENKLYKQECSSCHYLYNPELLTEASWEAVLQGQSQHFGENLGLDASAISEILTHLKNNSAEKSRSEWGRKITRSSGSKAYLRITEVPWIIKEHRKISDETFKRPSIKSRSNCTACHKNAASGDFEEDSVSIPRN